MMNTISELSCRVRGHTIAYKESGEGEVVLLIHGITTYSFIWRNIIPLLSKQFRVLALDLPGCGASCKNITEPYSIANHARTIHQFLEVLNIHQAHIVGHDVGGGITQLFAVDHPQMCKTISLVNSVAYDFWPVQPIIAMRTPIVRQLAMASLDMGALRLIVQRGLYHRDKLNQELLDYFWAPMKTREGRKAFLHFAASLDNKHLVEISAQLTRLSMPALIVRGDADLYLSGVIAEKLAENIPTSRLVRIATASHFIQEDEPERLAAELLNFFAS